MRLMWCYVQASLDIYIFLLTPFPPSWSLDETPWDLIFRTPWLVPKNLDTGFSTKKYLMQNSGLETIQSKKIDQQNSISINDQNESIVSLVS